MDRKRLIASVDSLDTEFCVSTLVQCTHQFGEVNMRVFFLLTIALFCLSGVSLAQGDAQTETQLLTTLHKMYAAEKKHDFNFIRSYLSDDFAEVGGDARVYNWKRYRSRFCRHGIAGIQIVRVRNEAGHVRRRLNYLRDGGRRKF
jgi:hypothetical protein